MRACSKVVSFIIPVALLFVTIILLYPSTSYFWLQRLSFVPLSMSSSSEHPTILERNSDGDFRCREASSKGLFVSPLARVARVAQKKNATPSDSFIDETCHKKRHKKSLYEVEDELSHARAAIRMGNINTIVENNNHKVHDKETAYDDDYIPNGPMYWNAPSFHRSYMEMENRLKVFVYEEGEPPLFHSGHCKSTYAIEGIFIQTMERSRFRTYNPESAHIFFLPISVAMLTHIVYVVDSHDWSGMKNVAKDYVDVIANKYRFWNRSRGADHFMVACHDWGPEISFAVPNLYNSSIRALCNANTSEHFNPSRDVSIPEILLPSGTTKGLLGGPSTSQRPILVFYAGGVHGPIRPILLAHWENKDPDVQVHKYLQSNVSYYDMMRKSKYCICPSGYEVASPRMVEALYLGCVPVLIKDHYVIPFSDVLNWKSFSVIIPVEDIPNLKNILMGISTKEYIKMKKRGREVRKHFEVNSPPKRYDVFHMILHSIWLRRLNVRVQDVEQN